MGEYYSKGSEGELGRFKMADLSSIQHYLKAVYSYGLDKGIFYREPTKVFARSLKQSIKALQDIPEEIFEGEQEFSERERENLLNRCNEILGEAEKDTREGDNLSL